MIQNLIKKVFGSRSDREMKQLLPLVDEVNQFAESLTSKSDDELRGRTQELKASIREIRIIAEEKAAKEINYKV